MADDRALPTAIPLPIEALRGFCERWGVQRLEVFGSVLRDDFRPDSDVDFLFELKPGAAIGLVALARMERELGEMVGRDVDLVSRHAVERSPNWLRRHAILATARIVIDAA
jgi:hypothetical protein